jgi:hypothetical protein
METEGACYANGSLLLSSLPSAVAATLVVGELGASP